MPRSYAQQTYQQPAPQVAPPPEGRGLFNSRSRNAPQIYAQPQPQQPYVVQYTRRARAPRPAAPNGAYASASPYEQPYTLDAGDKLRIVVFGQDGISNTYIVDAGGNVNLPLIGTRAGARRHHRSNCRSASPSGSSRVTCASRMSRSRSRPTGRSSSSAR